MENIIKHKISRNKLLTQNKTMATLDLTKYGITGTTEIVHNPSFETLFEEEMKAVAGNMYITTDDGSYGFKGVGTARLEALVAEGKKYTQAVAIGPMIMMKFVCQLTKQLGVETIVSMNPIMVDGTGMCGACRLMVGGEVKFACVDGPEFDGHEVDFAQAMQRMKLYATEEGRLYLRAKEGDTHHGGCGNCGN